MSKVKMTIALGDYDRVRPLWDGSVEAEGLDLNVVLLPVEEIFFRQVRNMEFDASEMSMSSYIISRYRDNPRMMAIPVFPSRKFRHADIYVNSSSAIKHPEDLRGARIGCPEYQMTAPVWMRGIMEDIYGVEVTGVHWLTGGTERPGREERLHLTLPPQFKVSPIPAGRTLFQMLRDQELDAVMTARVPSPFVRGESWIARLFPDYKQVESEYYRKTGIFPMMHTVALRQDFYDKHPWAAQSLYKAFCKAKDLCFDRHLNNAALTVSLPWFSDEIESTFRLMGRDFWPYGMEKNSEPVARLLSYMRGQGLVPQDYTPAPQDLFAPNTHQQFGV